MNNPTLPLTAGVVIPGQYLDLTAAHIAVALSRHGREKLETFVAVAIDILDLNDGDFDLELDDADTGVEDEPLGCNPETDLGPEDEGEPDDAARLPVPHYALDQSHPIRLDGTEADMPCADIGALLTHRPLLGLRFREAS